ncbi:hypothetical protein ED733_000684 [Metarhizium rileyi]|uniref:Cytochrome P450 n=1 Tax=Metarhizium rileyi (strain RCEF 4871) TaxID=1649241 RepID=A0A5C6FZF4_METRR|nr:hypothetical protein ED733_000684 [Metarhizium rileyi]
MDIRTIATVFFSILLAHRAFLVFYRLYLHPLATFPGPRLAAVSTLYRAYYQFWRDGKLLHKTIKLHKKYGPVIRISPNEVKSSIHNRTAISYFDIYSTTFNGRKDPDFYNHLRVEADTILLIDDDTGEHKARFQPLASLFSSRQYGQHESNIAKNVERFSSLLSCSAHKHVPCRLAAGYRSLSLGVMNDFVFSDIPDNVKPMASVEFDDPLTIATGDVLNWTLWLTRNFPALSSIIMRLPSSLVSMVTSSFEGANQMFQIISQLVEHEKNHIGPKSKDCVMQRLLNAHRDSESKIAIPTPDATLRSEAVGFTLAGTADPPNILAFGTFMAARDSEMQKGLYKELRAIWPDLRSPAPSYNLLHQLPLLVSGGIHPESPFLELDSANPATNNRGG